MHCKIICTMKGSGAESKVSIYPQAPLLFKHHTGSTAGTVLRPVNDIPFSAGEGMRNILVRNPAVPVHFLTSVLQL